MTSPETVLHRIYRADRTAPGDVGLWPNWADMTTA